MELLLKIWLNSWQLEEGGGTVDADPYTLPWSTSGWKQVKNCQQPVGHLEEMTCQGVQIGEALN